MGWKYMKSLTEFKFLSEDALELVRRINELDKQIENNMIDGEIEC